VDVIKDLVDSFGWMDVGGLGNSLIHPKLEVDETLSDDIRDGAIDDDRCDGEWQCVKKRPWEYVGFYILA
jgi:hypothetical protein